MSFTFGGSASKSSGTSSGTSNTTTNSTTNPNVPDWLQTQTQNQSANIAKLGSMDPYSLVAKADPLQAMGSNPATYGAIGGMQVGVTDNAAPTVRSQSAAAGLNRWINPFEQQVVDTSAADFDHNAAMQHAQRTLDEAHSGAFGGSGAAIATTMGDDNSDRARAALLSGLRSSGFDRAASNSQQDATRAQSASEANANLAIQQEGLQLQSGRDMAANLAQMFGQGTDLRAIQQQQLTAPLDLDAWMNSQFGTLPANLFVGQTTDGTSNTATTGKSSGTSVGVNFNVAGGPGQPGIPIPH
jgi:hypothetical protein